MHTVQIRIAVIFYLQSESGSLTIFAVPLRVDSDLVNRMLRLRNDPEFLFPVPRLKSLLP